MTLEDLRNICMQMPHATEDIKYGSDICFSVAGKIFCGTRADGPFRTGFKCTEEDFGELTERDGIVPMPRLAATFWIRIEKANALSTSEWKVFVKKSYDMVVEGLPEKVKASIKK